MPMLFFYVGQRSKKHIAAKQCSTPWWEKAFKWCDWGFSNSMQLRFLGKGKCFGKNVVTNSCGLLRISTSGKTPRGGFSLPESLVASCPFEKVADYWFRRISYSSNFKVSVQFKTWEIQLMSGISCPPPFLKHKRYNWWFVEVYELILFGLSGTHLFVPARFCPLLCGLIMYLPHRLETAYGLR